jgi:hypothetical protein
MDYSAHYSKLINRAVGREVSGYSEKHHIVPRCMGGSDDPSNLVRLTAREHFVAHQLLVKMHPGQQGLIFAAFVMTRNPWGKRQSNRPYAWLRERHSLACNTPERREKSAAILRKRHSENPELFRRATLAANTPENIAKRLVAFSETYMKPETKQRFSEAAKIRWRTRDRKKAAEVLKKTMGKRETKTRGSSREIVQLLPNGFIVNEFQTILAAGIHAGFSKSKFHSMVAKGHPMYEVIS